MGAMGLEWARRCPFCHSTPFTELPLECCSNSILKLKVLLTEKLFQNPVHQTLRTPEHIN